MTIDPQPASASEIVLRQLMLPAHTNPFGNVHGAEIMKLADEAGGLAAMRHSRCRVVTKLVDRMSFDAPVFVGDLVHVTGRLTWNGRTSMETRVTVESENVLTGNIRHIGDAWLVFVAIDANGNPHPVPPLAIETETDRLEWEAAEQRRLRRLG